MTDKELTVWSLQKRFDETCLNFRHASQLYVTWYTVFTTFNIAALAWFGSHQSGSQPFGFWIKWLIVSAFTLKNVLAILSSLKMVGLTERSAAKLIDSIDALSQQTDPPATNPAPAKWFSPQETPIPLKLARWSFRANAVGTAVIEFIWLILAVI